MARAAYLMDKIMVRVGSAASRLPMLSSSPVPCRGIMGARVVENDAIGHDDPRSPRC